MEAVREGPLELLAVLAGRGILVDLPPVLDALPEGVCVAERTGVDGVAAPLPRPI